MDISRIHVGLHILILYFQQTYGSISSFLPFGTVKVGEQFQISCKINSFPAGDDATLNRNGSLLNTCFQDGGCTRGDTQTIDGALFSFTGDSEGIHLTIDSLPQSEVGLQYVCVKDGSMEYTVVISLETSPTFESSSIIESTSTSNFVESNAGISQTDVSQLNTLNFFSFSSDAENFLSSIFSSDRKHTSATFQTENLETIDTTNAFFLINTTSLIPNSAFSSMSLIQNFDSYKTSIISSMIETVTISSLTSSYFDAVSLFSETKIGLLTSGVYMTTPEISPGFTYSAKESSFSATTEVCPTNTFTEIVSTSMPSLKTVSAGMTSTETVSTDMPSLETISAGMTSTETVSTDMISTETVSTDMTSTETVSTDMTSTETVSTDMTSTETVSTGMRSAETVTTGMTSTETVSTGTTSIETIIRGITSTETMSTGMTPTTVSTIIPFLDTISTFMTSTETESTGMTFTETVSTGMTSTETVSILIPSLDTISTVMTSTETESTGMTSTDTVSTSMTSTETVNADMTSTDILSTSMPSSYNMFDIVSEVNETTSIASLTDANVLTRDSLSSDIPVLQSTFNSFSTSGSQIGQSMESVITSAAMFIFLTSISEESEAVYSLSITIEALRSTNPVLTADEYGSQTSKFVYINTSDSQFSLRNSDLSGTRSTIIIEKGNVSTTSMSYSSFIDTVKHTSDFVMNSHFNEQSVSVTQNSFLSSLTIRTSIQTSSERNNKTEGASTERYSYIQTKLFSSMSDEITETVSRTYDDKFIRLTSTEDILLVTSSLNTLGSFSKGIDDSELITESFAKMISKSSNELATSSSSLDTVSPKYVKTTTTIQHALSESSKDDIFISAVSGTIGAVILVVIITMVISRYLMKRNKFKDEKDDKISNQFGWSDDDGMDSYNKNYTSSEYPFNSSIHLPLQSYESPYFPYANYYKKNWDDNDNT